MVVVCPVSARPAMSVMLCGMAEDWGELGDLFGPGNEPDLVPYSEEDIDPVWVAVSSSNVAELIYFPRDSGPRGTSLGVRFVNGGEYYYYAVPRSVYASLLAAYSVGQCHWQAIRRRGYDYWCAVKPDTRWKSRRRRGGV